MGTPIPENLMINLQRGAPVNLLFMGQIPEGDSQPCVTRSEGSATGSQRRALVLVLVSGSPIFFAPHLFSQYFFTVSLRLKPYSSPLLYTKPGV